METPLPWHTTIHMEIAPRSLCITQSTSNKYCLSVRLICGALTSKERQAQTPFASSMTSTLVLRAHHETAQEQELLPPASAVEVIESVPSVCVSVSL